MDGARRAASGDDVRRIVADLRSRAGRVRRRVIFPESGDARTRHAVRTLAAERIVDPVLVLDPQQPESHAAVRALAAELELVLIEASDQPVLTTAMERVARGEVDACVAGAAHTTADVVRAALRSIGRAPGVRLVSSAFYMVVARPGDGGASQPPC